MEQYISKSALVAEIKRMLSAFENSDAPVDRLRASTLIGLLSFIDSLEVKEVQEEPVSEDLNEAAIAYNKKVNFVVAGKIPNEHFIAGAEWHKEQMMDKTVETTFNVSLPSGLYDKLWIKGCKDGDKLLVIKKDLQEDNTKKGLNLKYMIYTLMLVYLVL